MLRRAACGSITGSPKCPCVSSGAVCMVPPPTPCWLKYAPKSSLLPQDPLQHRPRWKTLASTTACLKPFLVKVVSLLFHSTNVYLVPALADSRCSGAGDRSPVRTSEDGLTTSQPWPIMGYRILWELERWASVNLHLLCAEGQNPAGLKYWLWYKERSNSSPTTQMTDFQSSPGTVHSE